MTMGKPKKKTLAAGCPLGAPLHHEATEGVGIPPHDPHGGQGAIPPRPPSAGVIELRSDGTPASSVTIVIGLGISQATSELSFTHW